MAVEYMCDGGLKVYANGRLLFDARESSGGYRRVVLDRSQMSLFHLGSNTLAVQGFRKPDGPGIDLGLSWIQIDSEEDRGDDEDELAER